MASAESIIEPRTDSSASRLWGGTRSGRIRLASSAVRAISSPPSSRRGHPRLGRGPGEGYNGVDNSRPTSRRDFPCHFVFYLHSRVWKTLWRNVENGSDTFRLRLRAEPPP